MTNLLAPVAKAKFFDNNGRPAVGYKLFTYEAGTSTKADTFPSADAVIPNPNPITLDYRGEANVWTPPNVAYKFVFAPPSDTDPPTNPIWTVDDIVDSQLVTLYGGVDTGVVPNAYVVSFDSNFTAYQDGIIVYFLASKQNTGASTINVNQLGPVPILTPGGDPLPPGAIVANQMTGVIYRGGSFYLITVAVLSGSFTATLSGMAATVTGPIFYRAAGGIVTLTTDASITGTSNSPSMTISGIPQFLVPSRVQAVPCSSIRDNGSSGSVGVCTVSFGSIIVNLLVVSGANVLGGGPFTASGSKGLLSAWSITYQL